MVAGDREAGGAAAGGAGQGAARRPLRRRGAVGVGGEGARSMRGLAFGVQDVIARRIPTRGTISGSTRPYA